MPDSPDHRPHPAGLRTLAATAALSLILGGTARAQADDAYDRELAAEVEAYRFAPREPVWAIEAEFSAHGAGDLDKSSADVSISRRDLRLRYGWPPEEGTRTHFEVHDEKSRYDFTGTTPLGLTEPFKNAKETGAAVDFTTRVKNGTWVLNAGLELGREPGASPTKGVWGEFVAGRMWKVDETLQLGLGLYGFSKLEDDAEFYPFPILEWQATDDLRIGFIDSSNPGFGLRYDWTEHVDGYVNFSYDVHQFRLEHRTMLPDGAALDEELGIRAGLVYTDESVKAEVFAGASRRELSVEAGSHLVQREKVDPAGVVGASITFYL